MSIKKEDYWAGILLTILCLSVIPVSAARDPLGPLESSLTWRHQFPGSINLLEVTPQGYIHAVSHYGEKIKEGKKKYFRKKRFLFQDDQVIYKAEAATTTYIGDATLPLVMEAQTGEVVVKAIPATGKKGWTYPIKGIPAAWLVDSEVQTALFLVMPLGWTQNPEEKNEAEVWALNTQSGALRWNVSIGTVTGGINSYGSEFDIEKGDVWVAAGGKAARIDLASGKLYWSAPITPTTQPNTFWLFSGEWAAAARGDILFLFDKNSGLKWSRQLREESGVAGLLWTTHGLLSKFQNNKGLILAMLDPESGDSRWEHTLKHNHKKFHGPPPMGMVEAGGNVIVAAKGFLHSYDLKTGEEKFAKKLSKQTYWKKQTAINKRRLQARPNHFILYGRRSATAFNFEDGSMIWQQSGFEPPEDILRRMRGASLQAGFTGFHQIMPTYTSAEAASYARGASRYSEGSFKHQQMMLSAEIAQTNYAFTAGQQQGFAAAKFFGKTLEIELDLYNRRMPAQYVPFYRIRNKKVFAMQGSDKANGVLLDLDSGEIKEEVVIPKASNGCISQVIMDPIGERMILTYRQMTFICKDEDFVEVFDLTSLTP